jgi:YaiO family outer membrane protein
MNRYVLLILMILSTAAWSDAYTEIGANAGVDALTGSSPDWRSQEVTLNHRDDSSESWYGALGHTQRFDLDDDYLTAGAFLPVGKPWSISGELSLSPEHNVLPRYSIAAGAEYDLPSAWDLQVGLRHASYSTDSANIASFTAEHYFGNWRAAYTLFEGDSGGASGAAHMLRTDWYYGDRSRVGLGLVTGRDVERIDPANLVVTSIHGAFLTGEHAFDSHWALSYTVGVTSLQDFYTRRSIQLGLVYRF